MKTAIAPVIDFESLAAFWFQWECALCGETGLAMGLAQAYADAQQHRGHCHG